MRGWLKAFLGLVCIGILFFVFTKQFDTVTETSLPQFIAANVVDPRLVVSVSKFRSGAGHSNPGWPETCRSMKHYITVYDSTKKVDFHFNRSAAPSSSYALNIISPVNGTLSKGATGEGDDQLNISVDGQKGWSIRLEHVHLLPGLGSFRAHVQAGQVIATVWNSQNFDLSVFYHYYRGDELFSYFEVLPDSLFAAWQAQGATTKDAFIFTKEYRDAHPLTCLNDRPGTPSFADARGNVTENWIPENFVQFKAPPDPERLN